MFHFLFSDACHFSSALQNPLNFLSPFKVEPGALKDGAVSWFTVLVTQFNIEAAAHWLHPMRTCLPCADEPERGRYIRNIADLLSQND